jgi:hypothetical protein
MAKWQDIFLDRNPLHVWQSRVQPQAARQLNMKCIVNISQLTLHESPHLNRAIWFDYRHNKVPLSTPDTLYEVWIASLGPLPAPKGHIPTSEN